MVKNSKGKIYYGMHFYPGVAEYQEPGKDPYRVYLNEDTLRSMDPSFAGRPIFVEHVDEVDTDIDNLRKEADGWVIESFFNSADGKHWVKFIAVSERSERAIRNGFRLSNAYVPSSYGSGGLWNGVTYAKEVTSGEFEHLAIVKNPRYEESVIMTPEEFKKYNEDNVVELKRLSNSKEKGESNMGLNIFKRTKVENALDLEGMSVVLPKSKKEMTIINLVEEMDKIHNMHGYANGDHLVKVGENEMSVNELVKKHMAMNDELEGMKKSSMEKEHDLEETEESVDVEGDDKAKNDDAEDTDPAMENMDDKDATDKKLEVEKKKNEADKKAAAKKKADALKNAHLKAVDEEEVATVEFSTDQVARGKSRYGSN